ncbi:MAG: DUF1846 family protein [Desulfomonilia bacterium]|nr:DUF1846 family protein [Desulfomonilia bacterium]
MPNIQSSPYPLVFPVPGHLVALPAREPGTWAMRTYVRALEGMQKEALVALSISAASSPAAQFALQKVKELKGCEVHMTHIPTPGDEAGLRRLGVNVTSDPNFASNNLFIT